MGRAKQKRSSTRPGNPRSPTRRRINGDETCTTYDGVLPTIDSTVRIMTPGNGYLKFGVVTAITLDGNNAGIPSIRVKLYNGDYLIRPQNEVRVYGNVQNHYYGFFDLDGKFLSVGDKVHVLDDGGHIGRVEEYIGRVKELLPSKVWVKRDSGEYEFVNHDDVVIMEEHPDLF